MNNDSLTLIDATVMFSYFLILVWIYFLARKQKSKALTVAWIATGIAIASVQLIFGVNWISLVALLLLVFLALSKNGYIKGGSTSFSIIVGATIVVLTIGGIVVSGISLNWDLNAKIYTVRSLTGGSGFIPFYAYIIYRGVYGALGILLLYFAIAPYAAAKFAKPQPIIRRDSISDDEVQANQEELSKFRR
ncbi:hypothetical protein CL689_00105 [Candidatus Saccharibacteria bacterium]|nr:hypothetical protein [Candidatus Saccharibacteria bacterium]MBJ58949.1 hypothetical protein [Candidatus Saccharibacteria bacterium]MBQ68454.1 hypothetical protein [Candidatus Saccharibacteria bacterium]|tara:strand:+ start:669 stop:1241 length:573 start_codon:yes stop_codon:yes gene_type:complete